MKVSRVQYCFEKDTENKLFFYFFKLSRLTSESLPAVILTLWPFTWYFVVVCGCTCYGFQVTLGLRCSLGSLLLKTIPTVHTQRTWSLLIRLTRLWSAWTHFADESRSAQNTICSHRILQKVQTWLSPTHPLPTISFIPRRNLFIGKTG